MANEKVRDFIAKTGNPVGGLAQWVFRKVLHHDPMAVVDTGRKTVSSRTVRGSKPVVAGKFRNTTIRVQDGVEVPMILFQDGDDTVVYNLGDGRSFEIKVREMSQQEVAALL